MSRGAPAPTAMLELLSRGPEPLVPGDHELQTLEIAAVIPPFRRGSGGHATIVRILRELGQRGHRVSAWLEDDEARHAADGPARTRRSFAEFFSAVGVEFHADLSDWDGADIALATGWQTVARVMRLRGCGARAYLVQDHEPDFYGASAEALWAAQTYRYGLHCIAASPWLAALLSRRYGSSASHFDLALDHDVYTPAPSGGTGSTVVFYSRESTPRRAVPLGLLALEELSRRRPTLEIVLFGGEASRHATSPYRHVGVLAPTELADLYRRARVGMVLSLTNPSLIGLEMMACGLPCVELASASMLASFGRHGALELAEAEPLALCAAIEGLLDDDGRRTRARERGVALTADRTWERAADQVEAALRELWRKGAPEDDASRGTLARNRPAAS